MVVCSSGVAYLYIAQGAVGSVVQCALIYFKTPESIFQSHRFWVGKILVTTDVQLQAWACVHRAREPHAAAPLNQIDPVPIQVVVGDIQVRQLCWVTDQELGNFGPATAAQVVVGNVQARERLAFRQHGAEDHRS